MERTTASLSHLGAPRTNARAALNGAAWRLPRLPLALGVQELHVWRAWVDVPEPRLAKLAETLSLTERERANRFYFERHRKDFIAAHGILRSILGYYLGTVPAHLTFATQPGGKPYLLIPRDMPRIRFNLSHSCGLALLAVALDRDVGVDLERIRALPEALHITERYFTTGERDAIRSLPPREGVDAFFRCWTLKEAYIKARGCGFSLPLNQFEVVFAPGEPACLASLNGSSAEAFLWWVADLDVGSEYAAACAAERQDWVLRLWEWSSE